MNRHEAARESAMVATLKRINNAKTVEALQNLELSIERVYNAGFLTASELSRLDRKIVDKFLQLEGVTA